MQQRPDAIAKHLRLVKKHRMRAARDAQNALIGGGDFMIVFLNQIGRADAVIISGQKIDGRAKIGRQTAQVSDTRFCATLTDAEC